ncbi:MAG: recombinase family protein [Streptosporangiaceae bacterium]
MTLAEALVLGLDEAEEWADIGYTRISDDRTGVAASPARQRRKITEEAAGEGYPVGRWFEDLSKSAYLPGVVRPAFEALLEACEAHPVRRVWVLHDDRLVRDGDDTDLPRLIRALAPGKVIIRCVEAADIKLWQAEGKMSARVRNAVNAYESERKRERVELATADRARKGRFPGGGRRFGYAQRDTRIARHMDEDGTVHEETRPAGPLVLVPAEAEAIAEGYAMIMAGGSVHGVTRDWRDERGLTGPKGAAFTPTAVRDVLLRPANAGLSVHKGQIVGTGEWPAITDPDTYATVRALLTAPERRTNRGRPAAHLLSGLLVCGTCGEPMYASSAGGAKYRCQSGRARPDTAPEDARHANRVRARLEAAVTEVITGRIKRRGTLTRPPRNPSGAVAAALAEAEQLRGQIEGYQARAAEFDPADLAAILRGLRARLDQAQARITAEAGTPVSDGLAAAADIRAAWIELDTASKRAAIKEQVERITIGPGLPGTRHGAMHNVTPEWRED